MCMQVATPDGPMQMWFAGEYREVVLMVMTHRAVAPCSPGAAGWETALDKARGAVDPHRDR